MLALRISVSLLSFFVVHFKTINMSFKSCDFCTQSLVFLEQFQNPFSFWISIHDSLVLNLLGSLRKA
eukprot:Skav228788  [mRNA]  locus=scaffold589:703944:704463:+ [translate_table: standard]